MALEIQKYFMKKMFQIEHTETVRPSLKEIADDFCNLVVSRLKRKETANVLLIGSPGNGKNFIIKKALEEAEDQCGEIKVTRISGLTDAKNISSALEFEFDRNVREVIILEDLVALSQHERWLYGLLEEGRRHAKIIIATSTKLDCLESLEKRIKSRFASCVKILTPPTQKEEIEIFKNLLLIDPNVSFDGIEEEKINRWNDEVEDIFEAYYENITDFTNKSLCIQDLQAIFTPVIAAITDEMIFDGKRLLEQLEYGMDNDIYSGCSIFEMIVVLCYCSLRKKGVSPIHFIALYQEYSVWRTQHNHSKKYDISRNEFKKCFERLIQLSILEYEKADKGVQKAYLPVRATMPLVYMHEKLMSSPVLPPEIIEKCGKMMAG